MLEVNIAATSKTIALFPFPKFGVKHVDAAKLFDAVYVVAATRFVFASALDGGGFFIPAACVCCTSQSDRKAFLARPSLPLSEAGSADTMSWLWIGIKIALSSPSKWLSVEYLRIL